MSFVDAKYMYESGNEITEPLSAVVTPLRVGYSNSP